MNSLQLIVSEGNAYQHAFKHNLSNLTFFFSVALCFAWRDVQGKKNIPGLWNEYVGTETKVRQTDNSSSLDGVVR